MIGISNLPYVIIILLLGGLYYKNCTTTTNRNNRLYYTPEPPPMEYEKEVINAPQPDECDLCLIEHKEMIKKIEKLNEEIVVLTDTHNNLKQMASIIKESLDGVRDFATRSNGSVI